MGMMGNMLGGNNVNRQASSISFGNVNDLNSTLNSVLNGFGIRLPGPNVPQPQSNESNVPNATTNTNTTTNSQVPTGQTNQQQFRVSTNPIVNLNNNISRLILPPEQINPHEQLNLR